MTQPQQDALATLSQEFTALSRQLNRLSGQLEHTSRLLTPPAAPQVVPTAPPPVPMPPPPVRMAPPVAAPVWPPTQPPPSYRPAATTPVRSLAERVGGDDGAGWIGKVLAVAGVAVTLIGVVLLLVLAAQAGILAPGVRVAAGAVLGAGLVGAGARWNRRPGGRTGAIALAATGIAAGYIDVIAVTTIYHWVAAAAGLLLAAALGGGGLVLARRWDSQHLGVLVLSPLLVLAPIVTGGVTLLLIGFLLALAAVSLPVQVGRDWIWLHTARIAAITLPLLVALVAAAFGSHTDRWLIGAACGIGALLAVVAAVVLLPSTTHRTALALLTAGGVAPVLAAGIAVDRVLAAALSAALAAALLAMVLQRSRIPGMDIAVAHIWSGLSAVSALISVLVAVRGAIGAPVVLALAVVIAIAGRRDRIAVWIAVAFATVGALWLTAYAPPAVLFTATELPAAEALSVLGGGVLLIATAWALMWVTRADSTEYSVQLWCAAAAVTVYTVTVCTVTAGVLWGGPEAGFLAGHMLATICWIGLAAALFVIALRLGEPQARTAAVAGGLGLTAAATAKLFLFDLGTLDGMFRVAAFIIVGLVLLGMGAGYARSLAQRDHTAIG